MNAMAGLAVDQQVAWEFIDALWNTPVLTGKYRHYDGCLFMCAMLALSGNYKIDCPAGEYDTTTASSTSASSQSSTSVSSHSATRIIASSSSSSAVSTSSQFSQDNQTIGLGSWS